MRYRHLRQFITKYFKVLHSLDSCVFILICFSRVYFVLFIFFIGVSEECGVFNGIRYLFIYFILFFRFFLLFKKSNINDRINHAGRTLKRITWLLVDNAHAFFESLQFGCSSWLRLLLRFIFSTKKFFLCDFFFHSFSRLNCVHLYVRALFVKSIINLDLKHVGGFACSFNIFFFNFLFRSLFCSVDFRISAHRFRFVYVFYVYKLV